MSTIVTRAGKGSPLTNTEIDSNFTNLNTDKLESDGSVLADKIAFDTTAALTPTTGQLVWDAETGTVDIGLNGATAPVMSVGEDQFYRVINQTGSSIAKGVLVMAAGTVGNSGVIKVAPWNGSQPSKTIIGLTLAAIPTENVPTESGLGYVLAFGKIKGIQTNGGNYSETWVNGDILFAGATGGLTKTMPAAPNAKTTVAIVISSHASNGTLFVRVTQGSNLAEDELVQLASLAAGDVLSYDSVDGRFENKTLAAAGIYATSNPAGYTTNTGTVTSVGGTGTVNGITLTGTVTSSGNLTLGGTLSGVNLASQVTGDLPFSNLAQGSALSVLGVTGNATADLASIAAASDHQVLRRSGTSVAFGAVALNQTNAITGTLPVANGGTGITSLGSGVATFLGTPSSANLAAAVTDETGSGALVFATSPALTTPNLGTPSAATLTNATGLPIVAGTTGTLSVARGGTGDTSYTNGQLLIGNTTGNTLTKATLTAGTGISITNGSGSISIAATNNGTVTSVGGTGTVNGITLTGTVTSSGNLTLGGTLSGVNLTTQVTGTLPVANGGTGATTLTANNVILGNGTSAPLFVAPSTTGNVLTSNGTTWTSAALPASVSLSAANTWTGTQTFSGSTSALAVVLNDAAEVTTVSATAANGTITYDITTQSVLYYTSNASANWGVNFRASAGTSLNTALGTGQSVTVAFLVTQGATAYYNNAVQIDGTTSGVTTRWLGGAPTAGNASGIDSYRYLIIKTGSATYTVLASVTQFKA